MVIIITMKRVGAFPRTLTAFLCICLISGLMLTLAPVGNYIDDLLVHLHNFFAKFGINFSFRELDGLLNAILFAVPMIFASLIWFQLPWWFWGVLGGSLSTIIESLQYTFLPRHADIVDIITNTSGAFLGAIVALIINKAIFHRPRRGRHRRGRRHSKKSSVTFQSRW